MRQAMLGGLGDRRDADGRPLGETTARGAAVAATEIVACPFHDARRGLPMNATALRQMNGVWTELCDVLLALRGPDRTVHAAWRAALGGTVLPALVPADRPVPVVLSSLYKACLGFCQVLGFVLLADDGLAEAPLAALGDGDELLAWLDRDRWLIGTDLVCAGPPRRIAEVWDRLATGSGPDDEPVVLRGLLWSAWLDRAVDEAACLTAVAVAAYGLDLGEAPTLRRIREAPPTPFLVAVTSRPDRAPEHARRLLSGRSDRLEALLGELPVDAVCLERMVADRR